MGASRFVSVATACVCASVSLSIFGASLASATPLFGSPVGEGTEAGQVFRPHGMAVDHATGDIYVTDASNKRINKFDGSGKFLFAWGWGVSTGAEEPQTCTTSCQRGLSGTQAGELCSPTGIAVDNDLLSASYGDLYVVNDCSTSSETTNTQVVEKFDASGKFLLEFGGHVNQTTSANVCVAGETCGKGTMGVADGEFEWVNAEAAYIAVGPGGAVYVGDRARVQVFEPSGAWRENISLAGLSATAAVTALAVNSSGDMFVKDEGIAGVREFEPDGAEMSTRFDEGSNIVDAISLDAAGDLFVSEAGLKSGEPCTCDYLKYASSGQELERFGIGSLVYISIGAMTWDETLGAVLADGITASGEGGVWAFAPPSPGPVVEPDSEFASPGLRGTATLEAVVNPEGANTTYRFEYVDEAQFQASGYASASTSSGSIAAGFEDKSASAHLSGLVPGDTYHYRIVATNSNGTATGPDHAFTATPPALVDGPWVTNVTSTSTTLAARIDPLGSSTEYRLEYGLSTSYGHTLSGNVGEGQAYVQIGSHQQELEPDTVYHYRLVTVSEVGTVETPDHTFTTQSAGGELILPDSRAWEQVSPSTKNGALITPRREGETMMQASEDGNAITYLTTNPVGSEVAGNVTIAQVLSRRGPSGWSSQDIESSHERPVAAPARTGSGAIFEDRFFSSDLSIAAVEPTASEGEALLSPDATEPTTYLRNNLTGTYTPLLSSSDVLPGTKFGLDTERRAEFVYATPDLAHVIMRQQGALVEGAKGIPTNVNTAAGSHENLFEWSAGKLRLVNVLPNGEASNPGAKLARGSELIAHSVSNDGRRVIWEEGEVGEGNTLYMRDMVKEATVEIGGPDALFQTASADGSKVFFNDVSSRNASHKNFSGDLMVYEANAGSTTDVSVPLNAGESADVAPGLMGTSEDGSYVYFVAKGVLASGASGGEDNLYVAHDTDSGWKTIFIAILSNEDERSWVDPTGEGAWIASGVSSRVSPDGRYVAFMSERSLTGYDNADAVSDQPDEEVYLYDAQSDRLICTSCDPTGARPAGVLDHPSEVGGALLVDRVGAWTDDGGTSNHWLAGSVPGWDPSINGESTGFYQPRYLSDSGRLFFDSPVGLVPQDTNGLEDVYEYEPVGVGDCTASNPRWVERENGCVNLLTAGTSGEESAFYDASTSGNDVFFITTSKLVSTDYDSSYDLYDAHVCSAGSPCISSPVIPPACTTADSCKPAPSPQPTVFGDPASATFAGQGNIVPAVHKPAAKSKRRPKRHKARKKSRPKPGKRGGKKSSTGRLGRIRRHGARSSMTRSSSSVGNGGSKRS